MRRVHTHRDTPTFTFWVFEWISYLWMNFLFFISTAWRASASFATTFPASSIRSRHAAQSLDSNPFPNPLCCHVWGTSSLFIQISLFDLFFSFLFLSSLSLSLSLSHATRTHTHRYICTEEHLTVSDDVLLKITSMSNGTACVCVCVYVCVCVWLCVYICVCVCVARVWMYDLRWDFNWNVNISQVTFANR